MSSLRVLGGKQRVHVDPERFEPAATPQGRDLHDQYDGDNFSTGASNKVDSVNLDPSIRTIVTGERPRKEVGLVGTALFSRLKPRDWSSQGLVETLFPRSMEVIFFEVPPGF